MTEAQFDQNRVLDFLDSPRAYGGGLTEIHRIDTHASSVFLAGDRAYKLKRAVKYPFLDFSTLALRRAAALNELAINRRTAPEIYFEVVPVTLDQKGELSLRGAGDPVEWILVMRRFDQADLYDRMAEEGRLPLSAMPALARTIALFHRGADRVLSPDASTTALDAILADNASEFAGKDIGDAAGALGDVNRMSREAFAALVPLLNARALSGFVRHCHGDLHLRNIVQIGGAPVLFDAIEFDDRIATVDVLYDLAFLLMDLGARKLRPHATAVLNAYLETCGATANLIGLAALPLFLATRAAIRAKVEMLRAERGAGRAEALANVSSYLRLAHDFLDPPRPMLIAIGGLSGSGKSSVARGLAPYIGAFPGAVQVRSDRERKRLFGAEDTETLPRSAYTAETSTIVYAACRKRAMMALMGGQSVILDAVHAKAEEREASAEVARRLGVPFTGIWLEAAPDVMRQRLEARKGDVSDATPAILDQQLAYERGEQSFAVVDAGRPLDEVVAACLKIAVLERAA